MIWFVRRKMKKINEVFRPAAPIQNPTMLVGRETQIIQLLESIQAPGMHAAVYGSRGVGKTSVLNIAGIQMQKENFRICRHTCSHRDTYESIFGTLLADSRREMRVETRKTKTAAEATGKLEGLVFKGGSKITQEHEVTYTPRVNDGLSPNTVAVLFQDQQTVFVIDEYDRIKNDDTKTSIAETIKTLADRNSALKIVLAGVSAKGHDLVGYHPSTIRNIVSIGITRLDRQSLAEIITAGAAKLRLTFAAVVVETIANLSDGLPYFTHLLAQRSAWKAVGERRSGIGPEHLRYALPEAIANIFAEASYTYERVVTTSASIPVLDDEFMSPRDPKRDIIRDSALLILSIIPSDEDHSAERILKILTAFRLANRVYIPDSVGKIKGDDIWLALQDIASISDVIAEEKNSFYFRDSYYKAYVSMLAAKRFGLDSIQPHMLPA